MSSRAALAALIIPPLINLAGIIWPLLGMPSYERHFKPFQRLSVCTSALAHLLQSMLGLSWVQGTMTQYLLFDVFLLIINQVRWRKGRWHKFGARVQKPELNRATYHDVASGPVRLHAQPGSQHVHGCWVHAIT